MTVSNGLAWAADGKTMLYTDSPTFTVDAFDFDGSSAPATPSGAYTGVETPRVMMRS